MLPSSTKGTKGDVNLELLLSHRYCALFITFPLVKLQIDCRFIGLHNIKAVYLTLSIKRKRHRSRSTYYAEQCSKRIGLIVFACSHQNPPPISSLAFISNTFATCLSLHISSYHTFYFVATPELNPFVHLPTRVFGQESSLSVGI